MADRSSWGAGTFTLFWIGVATLVFAVVGVVAGLVRDDVPGTLGVVLAVGLGVSAVAIVAAVAVRERRT
ncbi:hypothetical protein [Nocardioides dongxiaopingii]|uniref:hypothetical protein n=1 Tax=Nocardioides dongxiaopingii TaxID=2576036 RepID=UPI0010C768C4|nr:hypothetical protein [Nocardioides dongxiaopingii]